MVINKNRAVFWLNRRIRELEAKSAAPDQESMAEARLSYAERQALIEKKAKVADDVKGELEALREVFAFVQEKA